MAPGEKEIDTAGVWILDFTTQKSITPRGRAPSSNEENDQRERKAEPKET